MKQSKLFNPDLGLLLLRITTGGLMLFHGMAKLIHGHDVIKAILKENGLPEFLWIGVPLTEVLAPFLLILGVFTRLSGLAISIVMLFAICLFFGTDSFSLSQYGGLKSELNLFFLFAGLSLFFTGGGKYVLTRTQNNWLN